MDKPATKEFVHKHLKYSITWATKYIHAARMGDEQHMALLNTEWDAYMRKLKEEVELTEKGEE